MRYPKKFVAAVKAEFPDWGRLHELLDDGATIVGRYLSDNVSSDIPIATILAATSLEDLQNAALRMQRRVDLYSEWCELYKKQFPTPS